jgi:hypothetical protein
VTSLTSGHDWEGKAFGEFATYIDNCREWEPALPEKRHTRRVFHSVRYENSGPNRVFPLHDCSVEGDEIRGQTFWMIWTDCVFSKIDFSHTRGRAHWTRMRFEKALFHHLMGKVSAAQTVFYSCNFSNAVLEQPVFLQCKFVKTRISGALIGAMFVDCEFEDVDLKGSRWEDPKMLDIHGTWKNAEQLWETSSPKAKAFFVGKPIDMLTE